MGSLTSGPSIPTPQPKIVYVPQTVSSTTSTSTSSDTSSNTDTSSTDGATTASDISEKSLLSRDRSRFGTVQTSFRGLLGLADNAAQRKTLLGE